MAVLALSAVPIAFLNEVNHFAVLLLLSGSEHLTDFDTGQLGEAGEDLGGASSGR